ncbi:MAG: P-II family nitrogen regulator [Lachnospiraceae bacterium]|nr:P-II family nitrogen regulator [Lachnospiraceae bacterium]
MSISLLTAIVARNRLPSLLKIYKEQQIEVNLIALGHGTAAHAVLNLLGLDNTEKAVCFSFVTDAKWPSLKKELQYRLHIDVPGTGIAFLSPLSSVGGKRELSFLIQEQEFVRREESVMQGTKRELIMVICNQGYSEQVMDAAREAGAAGGTVIHARGTGMQSAEKFFGVSLASEKDILYIVSSAPQKNQIMSAIMKKAGMETEAKALAFSLPVTDTAGLRLLEEEEEKEETLTVD